MNQTQEETTRISFEPRDILKAGAFSFACALLAVLVAHWITKH